MQYWLIKSLLKYLMYSFRCAGVSRTGSTEANMNRTGWLLLVGLAWIKLEAASITPRVVGQTSGQDVYPKNITLHWFFNCCLVKLWPFWSSKVNSGSGLGISKTCNPFSFSSSGIFWLIDGRKKIAIVATTAPSNMISNNVLNKSFLACSVSLLFKVICSGHLTEDHKIFFKGIFIILR